MTFSISALVSARDFHIDLIPRTIWKMSCHVMSWSIYHILYIDFFFQALTFILQKRSLNWQIAKINS